MVIIKISLVCIWEYGLLCSSGQRLFKPFVVVCAFYLPSRSIQLASQCNSFYAKSSLQHLSKNPASHFELMYFCTYAVNRYKIVRRVYSEYHTDYIPMYLSLPCFVLDDGDMVGGKRGRSPRFCRGKRNLLFNNLHSYNQLVFFCLPLNLAEWPYNKENSYSCTVTISYYLKFSLNHREVKRKVCLNIN